MISLIHKGHGILLDEFLLHDEIKLQPMNNPITHAILKQTAIDALARLNARLASLPPNYFMMAGRQYGFTRYHTQWLWRVNAERAYLENVINS